MRSNDAQTARDRCYAAIQGQDVESGQALWRALGRYHARMKMERGLPAQGTAEHRQEPREDQWESVL